MRNKNKHLLSASTASPLGDFKLMELTIGSKTSPSFKFARAI